MQCTLMVNFSPDSNRGLRIDLFWRDRGSPQPRRLRVPQRVVGLLAGPSCDPGVVGGGSKLSSSLANPPEQVGRQIGGGSGWRACAGSGGTRGGFTTTGGRGCGAAQALKSSTHAISISASLSGRVMGNSERIGVLLGDLRLAGAVVGLGLLRGAQGDGKGLGVHALALGQVALGGDVAQCVAAEEGDDHADGGQDGDEAGRHGAAPSQVARSAARRLASPLQRLAGSRQSLPW